MGNGPAHPLDALVLLAVFGALVAWTIWQGLRQRADALGEEMEMEQNMPCRLSGHSSGW